MDKRKNIELALEELGITNEAQLTEAIRSMKPINLSLMTGEQERKAS